MKTRPCNKTDGPAGLARCVEPFGHDRGPRPTKHSDGEGHTWGDDWKEAPRARSPIRTGEPDQWGTVEQAYRDGRKDERIRWMVITKGHAWCEWPGCSVVVEGTHARGALDFAHDHRRSQAQGYRPRKGGQNDADFRLLCRPHHEEYDGSTIRRRGDA